MHGAFRLVKIDKRVAHSHGNNVCVHRVCGFKIPQKYNETQFT